MYDGVSAVDIALRDAHIALKRLSVFHASEEDDLSFATFICIVTIRDRNVGYMQPQQVDRVATELTTQRIVDQIGFITFGQVCNGLTAPLQVGFVDIFLFFEEIDGVNAQRQLVDRILTVDRLQRIVQHIYAFGCGRQGLAMPYILFVHTRAH